MTRWEYQTVQLDVEGFFRPHVDEESVSYQLNQLGAQGWELVSAFDLNRGHGRSVEIVAMLKRPRAQ
jgi:hypothetical protein